MAVNSISPKIAKLTFSVGFRAMTEKSTIAGLISKAAKKLRDDFEHIRETISHSGEKGGETEDKVREFLNGHMPKRFHATKGFVIDAGNQMSDHQDVINYTAQFVGARNMGDLAVASDDEFVIPPCYVNLVAREDGAFSLNRLFTHLLSHLALYPRRPSIPPFSVLLEGTSSIGRSLGVYQFNTERRLVRYEALSA